MPLSLLLRCSDLAATRRFYTAVLGFSAQDSAEGTLTVTLHGGRIVFTELDLWQGAPRLSGTVYFEVPDVDAYCATVRGQAALAWPLQDMPYGAREFGVTDGDGYTLAFQQQRGG